jgi:hypothetical protein
MKPAPRQPLFTIGHSNHPFEHFLALLRRHGVEVVADVRSRPYSRFVPHFGKERLARILADEGLGYVFLGQELGGKPVQDDPPQARLDYRARIEEPSFQGASKRCWVKALTGGSRSYAGSAIRWTATGCI